jgi:hypothetical protein
MKETSSSLIYGGINALGGCGRTISLEGVEVKVEGFVEADEVLCGWVGKFPERPVPLCVIPLPEGAYVGSGEVTSAP